MDNLIYTAVSGASRNLFRQQIHANNLANVNTPGFRQDLENAQAQSLNGAGYASRHLAQSTTTGVSLTPGPVRETGRELDIAIRGNGLIALTGPTGEVYTRNGQITLGPEGNLTIDGLPVEGDNGPIILPPFSSLNIGDDGIISVVAADGNSHTPLDIDRIKLVDIQADALRKNNQGFLVADAAAAPRAEEVAVTSRHLESANVSAMDELLGSLSLSRQFETQIKMMKVAEDLANAGNRLIRGA